MTTYSSMIKAPDSQPLAMFAKMQQAGRSPNIVTYNSVITAGANVCNANVQVHASDGADAAASVITYNSLITPDANPGTFEEVLNIVAEASTYNSLITAGGRK